MIFSRVILPLQLLFVATARDHSIEMPAALSGAAFFSISLATNCCRYAGERRSGATVIAPTSLRRSCTEGVSIASTVGSWSFWITADGVCWGTKNPNQVDA